MGSNQSGQGEGSARQRARNALDPQAIRALAYELWERHGRAHGYDVQDWLEAESLLRERSRRTERHPGVG